MQRTTVEKACLALAGWNGTEIGASVIEPSRHNDLDHAVHRAERCTFAVRSIPS